MKIRKLPPAEELNKIFYYCDGRIFRKRNLYNKNLKFKEFGCDGSNKYIQISVNGESFLAHRVIWKMHYGIDPKELDHINGDKSDNRIENLREVSRSENNLNRGMRKDNKSGYNGVFFLKARNKWQAVIGINNEAINLGVYDELLQAVDARKKAEEKYLLTK